MDNKNKPAYPVKVDVEGVPKDSPTYERLMNNAFDMGNGLTKREIFAMAAMNGLLSNPDDSDIEPEYAADLSIRYTDALLKELEETND